MCCVVALLGVARNPKARSLSADDNKSTLENPNPGPSPTMPRGHLLRRENVLVVCSCRRRWCYAREAVFSPMCGRSRSQALAAASRSHPPAHRHPHPDMASAEKLSPEDRHISLSRGTGFRRLKICCFPRCLFTSHS